MSAGQKLSRDLQQTAMRLRSMVRRVERMGYGRNENATHEAIQGDIDRGNQLVNQLVDVPGYTDETYGQQIENWWTLERRAVEAL